MGYDMSTVNADGSSVEDCNDPEHGEHYWRRNIFGGGKQADRLVEVGMGYWSKRAPDVDWPEPSDYGITRNDEWDGEDDTPEYVGDPEKIKSFYDAYHTYLKATYSETPGIAVYKLCDSNDGWWVTKAECESALAIWEKNGRPILDKFGDQDPYGDTIPFLRAGAAHHGFRVW